MPDLASYRVTLRYIERLGLMDWKAREQWLRRTVLIWSGEHCAWWRPNRCGYTDHLEAAGEYSFADAYDATKGCGPEKKIEFHALKARATR